MDFITEDDCYVIYTEAKDFPKVKDALTNANYELLSADVKLIPATYAQIDESQEKMLEKLLDELEEDDDVQNVYYNIK